MLIQCKYCGSNYSDTELECPNCGAANDCVNRTAAGAPKTIAELHDWAVRHHLPLEQMRTYIGQDVRTARAFGIYKDSVSGDFVVYKNKSDGSRAERYRGKDEAYAVNELYQKIRSRVADQKAHQMPDSGNSRMQNPVKQEQSPAKRRNSRSKRILRRILVTIAVFYILPIVCVNIFTLISLKSAGGRLPYASTGYYSYGSDVYYHDYGDAWYIWDAVYDTWSGYDADAEWDLFEDYDSYYEGYSYDEEYGTSDWDEWYDDTHESWSYDNDYDWDWDYDYDWDDDSDWDSGWDDWDSDW